MLEPTYLTLEEWDSIRGTCFKILKEEDEKVLFQISFMVNRGDIPELDPIYPYPTYGFYFSATKSGFYFGACLGKTFYSSDTLSNSKDFLSYVKLKFPEYGFFLEKNYKSMFRG